MIFFIKWLTNFPPSPLQSTSTSSTHTVPSSWSCAFRMCPARIAVNYSICMAWDWVPSNSALEVRNRKTPAQAIVEARSCTSTASTRVGWPTALWVTASPNADPARACIRPFWAISGGLRTWSRHRQKVENLKIPLDVRFLSVRRGWGHWLGKLLLSFQIFVHILLII